MTFDVVIPTRDGRELLEGCLASLDQDERARVIVVDDGSGDDTITWLKSAHPEVRLVALAPALGRFSAVVNAGVRAGSGEAVVLLNNDVVCDPGFLDRLIAPLAADDAVGTVAAVMLKPGRTEIDSYGLEIDATGAGWPRLGGAAWPRTLDERWLLGPSGGAGAYRRSALDEVGLLDERMVAYQEDAELALRLRAGGWHAAGARDAVCVHLGGATFGRRSARQRWAAGWSRGFLLRRLRLGHPGMTARAIVTEAGVCAVDTLQQRDLAALRGRVAGWRHGGDPLPLPAELVNPEITFAAGLRRRRRDAAA